MWHRCSSPVGETSFPCFVILKSVEKNFKMFISAKYDEYFGRIFYAFYIRKICTYDFKINCKIFFTTTTVQVPNQKISIFQRFVIVNKRNTDTTKESYKIEEIRNFCKNFF